MLTLPSRGLFAVMLLALSSTNTYAMDHDTQDPTSQRRSSKRIHNNSLAGSANQGPGVRGPLNPASSPERPAKVARQPYQKSDQQSVADAQQAQRSAAHEALLIQERETAAKALTEVTRATRAAAKAQGFSDEHGVIMKNLPTLKRYLDSLKRQQLTWSRSDALKAGEEIEALNKIISKSETQAERSSQISKDFFEKHPHFQATVWSIPAIFRGLRKLSISPRYGIDVLDHCDEALTQLTAAQPDIDPDFHLELLSNIRTTQALATRHAQAEGALIARIKKDLKDLLPRAPKPQGPRPNSPLRTVYPLNGGAA